MSSPFGTAKLTVATFDGASPFRTERRFRGNIFGRYCGGAKRLRTVGKAYGTQYGSELLDMVSEVLDKMSDEQIAWDSVGKTAAARLASGGHFKQWRNEADAFAEMKVRIQKQLAD